MKDLTNTSKEEIKMNVITTYSTMKEFDNLLIEVQKFLQNECHYSLFKSQIETINLLNNNGYMVNENSFWAEENVISLIEYLKFLLKNTNHLKDCIYIQQLKPSDCVNNNKLF